MFPQPKVVFYRGAFTIHYGLDWDSGPRTQQSTLIFQQVLHNCNESGVEGSSHSSLNLASWEETKVGWLVIVTWVISLKMSLYNIYIYIYND